MKKKIFSILFALVLLVSFSLVTAVPVSAAGVPTIDGVISTGEWDGAASFNLKGYTAYVLNDDDFMYVAFDYAVTTGSDFASFNTYKEGTFDPETINAPCVTSWGPVWDKIEDIDPVDGVPETWSREDPTTRYEYAVNGATEMKVPLVELGLAPRDSIEMMFVLNHHISGAHLYPASADSYDLNTYTTYSARVKNETTCLYYQTIQAAIDTALSNDTISAAAGTYNLTSPIVVDESVTLTGDTTTPSNVLVDAGTITGDDRDCFQVKASDVTIQGFTIQGALDAPGTAAGTQNSGIVIGAWWVGSSIPGLENIVISYNDIRGCSKGISVYRAQHVTISYNDIHHCPTSDVRPGSWPGKGIMLYGDGPSDGIQNNDIDILNNYIYSNGLFGIELNHWETSGTTWVDVDVLIDGNFIYNNGMAWDDVGYPRDCGRGISANGWETGVTITNNEVYGHWSTSGTRFSGSAAGIRVNDSKGFVISDNNVHDNMRGIYIYGAETARGGENTGFIVTRNDVHGNAQGIVFGDGDVGYAHFNNIHNNNVATYIADGVIPSGAVNLAIGTVVFDATNNWWGDATGPSHSPGSGDPVSDNVLYNPWLFGPVVPGAPLPATFDRTLVLNIGWTLVSTDNWINTTETVGEGVILAYKYIPGDGWYEATPADLEPVDALYLKTVNGGALGITYLGGYPAPSSKTLVAGWNLISSATIDKANAVLSPLRYVVIGGQQGIGLTTLVSQGNFNQHTLSFYLSTLGEDDWLALAGVELNPFDGYWVYMNAGKVFGVVPN